MQSITFKGGIPQYLWNKSIKGATAEDITTIVNDAKLKAAQLYTTKSQVVNDNEAEYFDSNKRFTQAGIEALKSQALYSQTGKIETAKELRDALVARAKKQMEEDPEGKDTIISTLHMF